MTITRFCRLGDGRTISYREQGRGPALVMLHGWGMSSAVFSPLLGRLADGHRILAPDLPGHGRSHPGADYGLQQLAADLEEWLEIVEAGHIVLLGWSLGGMLAMELASRLDGRVRKLVLMSTTPSFVQRDDWSAGQPAAQVRILARRYRRDPGAALSGFFRSQFEGEDIDDHLLETLERELLTPYPLPAREAALGGLDTLCSADLRGLDIGGVPVLVLHGGRDRIIPAAAGHYLAGDLAGSRWVLLEDAGHAPFISRSEHCARALEDFMA